MRARTKSPRDLETSAKSKRKSSVSVGVPFVSACVCVCVCVYLYMYAFGVPVPSFKGKGLSKYEGKANKIERYKANIRALVLALCMCACITYTIKRIQLNSKEICTLSIKINTRTYASKIPAGDEPYLGNSSRYCTRIFEMPAYYRAYVRVRALYETDIPLKFLYDGAP